MQNGKLLAKVPVELPAADGSGRIQELGRLPLEALAPGTYELRAVARQGSETGGPLDHDSPYGLEPPRPSGGATTRSTKMTRHAVLMAAVVALCGRGSDGPIVDAAGQRQGAAIVRRSDDGHPGGRGRS